MPKGSLLLESQCLGECLPRVDTQGLLHCGPRVARLTAELDSTVHIVMVSQT